jgi:hypothetical protein
MVWYGMEWYGIVDESTEKHYDNLDLHRRQSNVALASILVDDCVKALEAKKQVDLIKWKNGVGKEIGKSPWFKVTQDRVDAFAVTTADPQWIHTSDAVNMGTPFGCKCMNLSLSRLCYHYQYRVGIPFATRSRSKFIMY